MLEEMHDPVLSQPISPVGSEPPLLSSEKKLCTSIWLSKPYSGHVFGFQVQSVNGNLNGTAKSNICTRKWSTGAQVVER